MLPLQSDLQKKFDILSDVIERSIEGDTNGNSADTSDRKWRDLPSIAEEANPPFITKTEQLLPNTDRSTEEKRINQTDYDRLKKTRHPQVQRATKVRFLDSEEETSTSKLK